MKYENPTMYPRAEVERIFASGTPEEIRTALVGSILGGAPRDWAERECIRLAASADSSLRQIAATCVGHVARIHGQVDVATVVPVLLALQQDLDTAPQASDAIDDLVMFAGYKRT
jgi:hypothetical protein